jgi:hypothetical protein
MKKFLWNVGFVIVAIALLTQNVWSNPIHGPAPTPDAASTAVLLGMVTAGLAGVRKFVRR